MTTFTKLTTEALETMTAMDLRGEAAAAIERGETVWFARGEYAGIGSEVVVFDNGRAGIATNGDAVWGESSPIADDGTAESWAVCLDEDGIYLNVDARQLCCYDGCHELATHEDCDGDACCDRCYWQTERFVELHSFDGASFDAESASAYESEMAELGWSVEVREPRSGEAEGTYYRKSDGTLQILGYSIEKPDAYRTDSQGAYSRALGT